LGVGAARAAGGDAARSKARRVERIETPLERRRVATTVALRNLCFDERTDITAGG